MNQRRPRPQTSGRLQRGLRSTAPIPTQIVSNGEFLPIPQTSAQARVERLIHRLADRHAGHIGISRREFLRTTGGMAAALVAMNTVFGRFFDVLDVELVDAAAFAERKGDPAFVFDVQVHYVSRTFDPADAEATRHGAVSKEALVGLRRRAKERGLNPALAGKPVTLPDLHWENFIKEVFLDSETQVGLISTPPGPYPQEAVVPPREMTHIRDELNRITGSQRLLAHGLVTPQLGKADLEFMEMQAETMHVDAWKCYTGSPPKGFHQGWWMDDPKIAYPMLEKARALRVPIVCVHKGLPLGPVPDYNHPRDLIRAAKDFPDIAFLVYHSGFLGVTPAMDTFEQTGKIPWTSEFCRLKREAPEIQNIYMELGSTFGQVVVTHPELCAHLLGQIIQAFGVDHVLWGTDSIWYGSPQWQIEAFRRFRMPDRLVERYGYASLTREEKAKIFGLNAARLFRVDVEAKRNALPKDYLSKIKMAYLDEGPAPSHLAYGWAAVP